jgi:hypothetical protein
MVSFLSNRQWTIAVIVGFLMLLLSLGAVLLVFPTRTTAQCEPQAGRSRRPLLQGTPSGLWLK